uniref:Uncharacterized protein n=1 Tax=Arundo donax TaxID=35708 RepID=A0A0A9DTA3_ARUDO
MKYVHQHIQKEPKMNRSKDREEMIQVMHAWLLARHPQHPIAPRIRLHVWHTGSQAHTS